MSANKQQAAQRVSKLRQQINELRYRYHVLNDPNVSDEVYDSLTQELIKLEQQWPELLTPDSPTQRVGSKPVAKFKPVAHQTPMLSLNDAFNYEQLEAWLERVKKLTGRRDLEFHLDIKMDGLAATVVYEQGRLVRGLTRGDGYTGEDVTQNLRTINSIPLELRLDPKISAALYSGRLEVRGEVILPKTDFARINEQRRQAGLVEYANPRNTAAGSVRQLDPKLTASRPLRFHAYSLVTEPALKTVDAEYQTAHRLGFIVNQQRQVVKTKAQIIKFLTAWEDKRHDLPFQSDGVVITVNDRSTFRQLGVAGKAPRGAIAFKYPAEQATTKLKDILVSIGRTGAATPFAVLEPVKVAGSTVQLATLHNESEVARKDVRIGDTVIVQKAGDVIPEVVGPLPKLRTGKERKFKMPQVCPVCNTKLVKQKVEEAVWRCPNKNCPARVRGQFSHYASKGALDIEGLGEKNVVALLNAGLITELADLYRLSAEQLVQLERFGPVSAQNLVDAIADKKTPPLDRFIYGLGIRHVGRQTAIDLAQHFGSLDQIKRANLEDFETVEGIGQVVAHSIFAWFNEAANQRALEQLQSVGVKPQVVKTGGQLKGLTIAVTGTLERLSRDDAAEQIRAGGGKFQSSVGKDTDYLVVGANPGASKVKSAQKYGTKQINETALLELLN